MRSSNTLRGDDGNPLPEILQAKILKSRLPTILERPTPCITEKLDLTFGVEFEFVVRVKTNIYLPAALQLQSTVGNVDRTVTRPSHQCLRAALQHHMMQVLRSNGILVNDIALNATSSQWTLIPSGDGESYMFDESYCLSSDYETDVGKYARFNRWTITTDGTIEFGDSQRGPSGADETDIAIELNTRKLHLNPASLQEVSHVLELLTSQFDIRTNESTGLHVHIGNAAGTPGEPFWLSTLKNLASLVTVCNPIIEQLHPPWRIHNEACTSPLEHFDDPGAHESVLVEEIGWIPTIADLAYFMAGGVGDGRSFIDKTPWYAYNFLQTCDGGYGTVEFRQHEGTVDYQRVEAWVLFCAGLVRWSSNAYILGVPRLVERVFGKDKEIGEGMSVNGLLQELGLHGLVPYYQSRLWAHEDVEEVGDGEACGWVDMSKRTVLEAGIRNMSLHES
ncbi:MAG: hypothetical protein M1835_001081 [Candelina submexicana]|nr:MAG: hypothetical protein M1835_001081 [Candelina submexicana]